MASKYFSSTETTNFARLSRLNVDVCCDVLRAVLKTKIPPPGLNAFLQSQKVHLFQCLEHRQHKFLFPPGGVFTGTVEDLNFSLIYKLIRNLQGINIPPHTKGWGKSPDKTDRSLAANIDRLRIQRNEAYGHLSTASLSGTDFKDKWDFIRQIIFEIEQGALTGNTYVTAVDNLLTVSMDPDTENEYIEKLRKQQDDFEAVVEGIKDKISNVKSRQTALTAAMGAMTAENSGMKNRQDTLVKEMDTLKAENSGMKNRQDTLVKEVDTLKGRGPKLSAMIETTIAKIKRERESYQFLATKSLRDADKKLQKNRIVIIKGNTGDGKSAIAIELLRLLCCDEEGRQKRCLQPLELHDIKDLDLVAPKSGLVIYFDDIFGKNVVCKGDVEEWEKREESVLSKVFESECSEGNFLLITIRSGILNSLGSSCLEKIFTEQNIVDLNEYKDEKEKKELLRLYEPKVRFDKWTDVEEKEIIKSSPDIGFPQCCRLFRDTPTLQIERVNFFKRPFHFMKSALAKLKDGKFYGLLYLFLKGGKVMENDLDPSNQYINKYFLEAAFAVDVVKVDPTNELVYNKGRKAEFMKELLESMLGGLLKKESLKKQGRFSSFYKFSHDSIEETVALLYGEKTPIGYIWNCPIKLLSYITTTKNTPNRIVISSDDQTNAMYKRAFKEFICHRLRIGLEEINRYSSEWNYLVSLDVWTDSQFLRGFVRYLSGKNVEKCLSHTIKLALLNQTCRTGSDECVLFLLSQGVKPNEDTPFDVVAGGSVRLLSEIMKYDVARTARARRSRSSNIHNIDSHLINVLHEACLFEREEMVTMLCDTYPDLIDQTDHVGKKTLHFVAQTGNCGIFQTVERTKLKSSCRSEVRKRESKDGHVVHRSCACEKYMSKLVNRLGYTVLHYSCSQGRRELSLYLCQCYPALTTAVDRHGYNCLHHIAQWTSDVDMFTDCERHVKQYVETTGGKYDITTILTTKGESVLDLAKIRKERRKLVNPLCDYLVKLFTKLN